MVIKDNDATKLAKGIQSDTMFEDLPTGGKDAWSMLSGKDAVGLEGEGTPPPVGDVPPPAGETPPAPAAEVPPAAPEGETPPVTPEGETPPAPAAEVPPVGDVPPPAGEGEDDKALQTIAAALGVKTDELIKAGEDLKDAAKGGDIEEIRKKAMEFETKSKDMEYQNSLLQEQLTTERSNSKRYLDEKRQAELDSREKSKIYDTIMDSEGLKNLVLYKQYSETNPDYAEKYKQTLREFFEKETGISLDSLVSQSKAAEKSAMDTGGDIFGGKPQKGELVGGMFEEI